jgi:hypothetical protein
MVGFHNGFCFHAVIKPHLRISIKDYPPSRVVLRRDVPAFATGFGAGGFG